MNRKFGWIEDSYDFRDHVAMQITKAVKLPPSVDLRALCPPIYDQGDLGSCTANGIAACLEFDRKKQGLLDFVPSRLFIYYNERAMEGTINEDAGASPRDGIKSVAKLGDCPENDWTYDISKFTVKPPANCYYNGLKYRAVSYKRLQTLAQIKACLASGYICTAGIVVKANFPMDTVTGNIPMPKGAVQGGHLVCLVGYNDNKQIFILRNSWGTAWGNMGYGYIPYKYISNPNLASDFWQIQAVLA